MNDTPPPVEPQWFNRDDAARYLGVSHMTIWRAVRDGHLTKHTLRGRSTRYSRTDLDAYARRDTIRHDHDDREAAIAALEKVRAAIPRGRPLISVTAVLEIIDSVTRDHTNPDA